MVDGTCKTEKLKFNTIEIFHNDVYKYYIIYLLLSKINIVVILNKNQIDHYYSKNFKVKNNVCIIIVA